jgi:hypothetical protein
VVFFSPLRQMCAVAHDSCVAQIRGIVARRRLNARFVRFGNGRECAK